jgi:hypothetical protein
MQVKSEIEFTANSVGRSSARQITKWGRAPAVDELGEDVVGDPLTADAIVAARVDADVIVETNEVAKLSEPIVCAAAGITSKARASTPNDRYREA